MHSSFSFRYQLHTLEPQNKCGHLSIRIGTAIPRGHQSEKVGTFGPIRPAGSNGTHGPGAARQPGLRHPTRVSVRKRNGPWATRIYAALAGHGTVPASMRVQGLSCTPGGAAGLVQEFAKEHRL